MKLRLFGDLETIGTVGDILKSCVLHPSRAAAVFGRAEADICASKFG